MKVTAYSVVFIILGAASLAFGLWSRGRIDQLLDEDALDEDEHEYRSGVLGRGALTLVVVGVILIGAGVALFFVRA